MKRNIVPFGIIAIVGIFAVIIVSAVGAGQRDEIRQADEDGGENQEEVQEEASTDPEEIFANSCANCHGADLTGDMGPDLTTIGGKMTEDEIEGIIVEGQGAMPGNLVGPEEAAILAEWLGEKK